jgi:hypothetical protein
MRHEKIFKRPDGSRVRVSVTFSAERYSNNFEWTFAVHVCAKNKRTWEALLSMNNYEFQKLSHTEQVKVRREQALLWATTKEIEDTMTELWQTLCPSFKT